MRQICLLFLFVLLASATGTTLSAQSDAFLQRPGEAEIWVSAGGGSTRTMFNTDAEERLLDTIGTDFSAYVLTINADYGLTENLELNGTLPIGWFSTTSEIFPDRSILAPAYLGLGATWRFLDGPVRAAAGVEARIPPGFHQGIYDDPAHPTFLSDGFFELRSTLFGAWSNGDNLWAKGGVGYAFRAEEPVDALTAEAEIGFSSVPGTGLFLKLSAETSLSDPSTPTRPFYAGAATGKENLTGGTGRILTIERQRFFDVAPGIFVDLSDRLSTAFLYRIRVLGLHTLRINGLYIGVGFRFRDREPGA